MSLLEIYWSKLQDAKNKDEANAILLRATYDECLSDDDYYTLHMWVKYGH